MGPLRYLFGSDDVRGGLAHVEVMWSRRHENGSFGVAEAEDAQWLLAHTADIPDLQLQLWPRLLGLTTRWAYMFSRIGPSGALGSNGSFAVLESLQRLIVAFLASHGDAPWAVRAPALLLLAVASTAPAPPASSSTAQLQFRTLACEAICSALMRSQRAILETSFSPSSPKAATAPEAAAANARHLNYDHTLLLPTANAVTDLCAAAQLVMEGMAADGDSNTFTALLAALMHTLGGALSGLLAGGSGSADAGASGMVPGGHGAVVAAAVAQEAAAAALAALHASCRQLASGCTRSAAAALALGIPAAAVAATGQAGMLTAAAEQLCSTAAANFVNPIAALPPGAWRYPGELQVAQAVAAAAAGGLLEGCAAAARLQSPTLQPLLLRVLRPTLDRLTTALLDTSAAASTGIAAAVTPTAPGSAAMAAATAAAAATGFSPQWQHSVLGQDSSVAGPASVLGQVVGYCWARLRLQPTLPSGELAPSVVADRMVEAAGLGAAAATASVGIGSGSVARRYCSWHPAQGALTLLLGGSLGIGRLAALAAAGAPAHTAAELLQAHSQGPLYGDTQLLARGALEALAAARQQAAAAAATATAATASAAGHPATAAAAAAARVLASSLLQDTAAAARRLHALYAAVADTGGGRAWLAALSPAIAGTLREMLDRSFVCIVSATAAAFDALAAPTMEARPPASALRSEEQAAAAAAAAAAVAVAALGTLADVQFCALQLGAHGELVARLSAAVAAAPAAALVPLLALLPCYPALTSLYGTGGSAVVAVSRLAFLMPLAASCVPHAGNVGAAAAAILPYIYVLLKGSSEAVTQAAHAVWTALLAALCEDPQGDMGGSGDAAAAAVVQAMAAAVPASRRGGGGVAVAASMVPYYLERCCQAPCGSADVELMERGIRQVLRSLPLAHPVKAWCVVRMAQQLADWAAACELDMAAAMDAMAAAAAAARARGGGGGGGGGMPPPSPSPPPPYVPLVQVCAAALGALVTELDFLLLPHAFAALDGLLLPPPWSPQAAAAAAASAGSAATSLVYGAGPDVGAGGAGSEGAASRSNAPAPTMGPACRTAILQQLHDVWLSCNDHARKPLLDEWLRGAAARVPAPPPQGRAGGSAARGGLGAGGWMRIQLR